MTSQYIAYPGHQGETLIIDPIILPEYVRERNPNGLLSFQIKTIEWLLELAGIKHLSFGINPNDGNEIGTFNLSGINNGVATGTVSSQKAFRVEVSSSICTEVEKLKLLWNGMRRQVSVGLKVPEDNLVKNVQRGKNGDIRSIGAWAKGLDSLIKYGIRQSGVGNLTHIDYTFDELIPLITVYSIAFVTLCKYPHDPVLPFEILLTNLIISLANKFCDKKIRASIFLGPQIDRAVLLALACSRLAPDLVCVV